MVRSDKEIWDFLSGYNQPKVNENIYAKEIEPKLILEVLLDMRGLLISIKNKMPMKEA